MLRFLLISCWLALLGITSAQRANDSFINPPPASSNDQGPIYQIGQTVNATWNCDFTNINLVLWTDFTMHESLLVPEPHSLERDADRLLGLTVIKTLFG